MEIPVGNKRLFCLHFSDEQIVLAQELYDLELTMKWNYFDYPKWHFQMSLKKTEYLGVNSEAKL